MINIRPIFFIVGVLLVILSVAMCIPAGMDLISGDPDWTFFATSATITGFFGILLTIAYRGVSGEESLGVRETFLLTIACWVIIPMFASLPFLFSNTANSFTDAVFESVSGLTTTGATVFSNLDFAPPGILLWRGVLSWLGGIGIVVMAMTILPTLRIGGMQLFQSEFSDRSDKIMPRVSQIASAIFSVYVLISLSCALLYWLAGMDAFEAICNMMTTVSTSGLFTRDASMQAFDNPIMEIIGMASMIAGGCTLVLFIKLMHGDIKGFIMDTQIQAFFKIICLAIGGVVMGLWILEDYPFLEALRFGSFNVISIITTTGFSSTNYSNWSSFLLMCLYFIMFIGGCTGSTSGGIKVFRFQILYEAAKVQMAQLRHPSGVFVPTYGSRPINERVFLSVLAFFALYVISFGGLALSLGLCGMDFITCISGSAAILGNVGPGLGNVIGPAGSYAPLPDMAKWIIMGGMLVGRLELLTIFIILTPGFWKN